MATFRRLKSGKWYAEVKMKGVRKSKSLDNKRELMVWASLEEAKILGGKAETVTGKTLKDALIRYADEVASKDKEVLLLKKIARHPFAEKLLSNLTTQTLQDWIDARLIEVKPNSVLREISALNPVLERCRKVWNWIDNNPLKDTTRPRADPARVRRCSQDEINAILSALHYEEDQPVTSQRDYIAVAFLLAIETAMRQGEIWGLDWSHIHLDQKYVHLPKTKNGKARDVPLTERAIELFKKLDQDRKPFPFPQYSCGTIFRHAVTMAGVNDFTFHDTRHEAITRLARKLDMLDLARMVGHTDPRSLMTYYNATATEMANRLN
ncbi:MAG: site-specific integrase [Emcibacteraceae bacterium]